MVLSKELKFAICFGLIIGAIISLFQVFVYCSEPVELSYITGAGLSFNDGGKIVATSGRVYYFEIEAGYEYTIESTLSTQRIAFGNSLNIGTEVYDLSILGENKYTFNGGAYKYIYFVIGTGNEGFSGTVSREPLDGLDGFVDQLVYSVGTEGLWSTFLDCVPLLILAVLWGLGFFLIVRFVVGIVKAKGGV